MITHIHPHRKTIHVAGIRVSVQPRTKTPFTVLRVAGLVDTGNGQQTVMLKDALPEKWQFALETPASKKGLSLPRRIANLNCVYTGRKFGVVPDVMEALKAVKGRVHIAAVVPEVIAPGDFMVFRYDGPRFRIRFAGVLRALPLAP